jgi:hypothetical protein
MIYEGTNEIQAIDLLVRKVLPDGGAALSALLDALAAEVDPRDAHATLEDFRILKSVTRELVVRSERDPTLPYHAADDYLRAVGLALFAWSWRTIARTPGADAARWSVPAQAARLRIAPEFAMRVAILRTQCAEATARGASPAP